MVSFFKGLKAKVMGRLSSDHQAGLIGIGWSTLSPIVSLIMRLGSTLILTRLLVPEEYGILGTALAVLTTLEWLSDLGIHPALIRSKDGGTPEFLLTGWWMGIGRGTLLSLSAALVAWPLASFYNQPSLFAVLLVLAMQPLLYAIWSPRSPMMEKDLDCKAVMVHWKVRGNFKAFTRTLAWSTAGVIALVSIYSVPTAAASSTTSMSEPQSQLAADVDLQ